MENEVVFIISKIRFVIRYIDAPVQGQITCTKLARCRRKCLRLRELGYLL